MPSHSASGSAGAAPGALPPRDAQAIIDHMNADHADALLLYCRAFAEAPGAHAATMTAIDGRGFEMSVGTAGGSREVRIDFASPIASKGEARKALVSLLGEARERLSARGARR